jgi:HEAT repeat protein
MEVRATMLIQRPIKIKQLLLVVTYLAASDLTICAVSGAETATTVPGLVKEAKSADPDARYHAALFLGAFAADADDVIPSLCELIHDKEPTVRQAALSSLIALGKPARKAVPTIRPLLNDAGEAVATHAALAIAELDGASPSDALPVFRKCLRAGRSDVAAMVAECLVRQAAIRPALADELESCLASGQLATLSSVCYGMGHRRLPPSLCPALRKLLSCEDRAIRWGAATILVREGYPRADELLPHLIGCLKEGDESWRASAALALGVLGRKSVSAVPSLIACTDTKGARFGPYLPGMAIWALGQVRPALPETVEVLTRLLEDEDRQMRFMAKASLAFLSSEDESEVWSLLLAQLRPSEDKSNAWSFLLAVLRPSSGPERNVAIQCLKAAGWASAKCRARLISELGSDDEEWRSDMAQILGLCGARAREAIPALIRLRNDPAEVVRLSGRTALALIDPDVFDVPYRELVERIQRGDVAGKVFAIRTLAQVTDRFPNAALPLVLALYDTNRVIRREALQATGNLDWLPLQIVMPALFWIDAKEPDQHVHAMVRSILRTRGLRGVPPQSPEITG